MMAGTSAHGQGHQTTFAMIVSSQTGIPVDKIRLVQSDTDLVRSGGGTGATAIDDVVNPAAMASWPKTTSKSSNPSVIKRPRSQKRIWTTFYVTST